MPKAIRITRSRSEGLAYCDQCPHVRGVDWTRERARVHADSKQHTVRFVIEDTTTYLPTRRAA